MNRLANVRLDEIRVNPAALREVNKEGEQFRELLGSIRNQGVLSSISLRYKPGDDGKQYELIDGLQRFSASQMIGTGVLEQYEEVKSSAGEVRKVGVIPSQILDKTDEEVLYAQIITNAQRVDTKPVEYARGLRRILAFTPTLTESELSVKMSKSPGWVSKQLGLLKLNDTIKPLVNEGKINLSNAFVLAKLPSDEQISWLTRAQTEAPDVFGAAVLERTKQLREANRKGVEAGPAQFTPIAHLRKKSEVLDEAKSLSTLRIIANETNAFAGIQANAEGVKTAFERGMQLALNWAASLDPKSVAAQRADFEERQKAEADKKARREAEKKAAKAKEAQDAADVAAKQAEAAPANA